MLKAVRFDEQDHKEILDYIVNYKDVKGKRNESEAMRFLMQKGLESLFIKEEPTPTPAIDVEAIKADLFAQIMAALPHQPVYSPPVQEPVYRVAQVEEPKRNHIETVQEVEKEMEKPTPPPKPKASPPSVDTSNPLLANLLGNINRG